MKLTARLLATLLLAITLSSCAGSSNTLFADNFSSKGNKWDQVTNATLTTDYFDDAYRILVNNINYDAWANPDDNKFTDVQVEVDATKHGGPETNDFGIICRYTGKGSYYYGTISSDGYYGIFKKSPDGGRQLGPGGELYSDKINQGETTNHIRFDCVGSTLTLYANGTMLEQETDPSYLEGNVGLIAGTYTEPGTDILFDNFVVYKPSSTPSK